MFTTRLLSAAFLVTSVFSFAQEHRAPATPPTISAKFEFKVSAPNAAEPWRIIPRQWDGSGSNAEEASLDGVPGFLLDGHGHAGRRGTVLTGPVDDTCYTLRTYVVARDSKNSDSTHPVRSSTCLPGSRLRLKTADAHSNLGNR